MLVVIAGLEDTVRGLIFFAVYMNSLSLQLLVSPLHSSEAVKKGTEIPFPVKFLHGSLYPVPCFYLYYIMCVFQYFLGADTAEPLFACHFLVHISN